LFPRLPKQAGCTTLQGAKQLYICFIRKTRAVVPPVPGQVVVQIQAPEARIRPIVQGAEPEAREQPQNTPCSPFIFCILVFI
jgi:hypothetical protein